MAPAHTHSSTARISSFTGRCRVSQSWQTLPVLTVDMRAGYDWSRLPASSVGTGYQVMMCRKGTYVTSLTVYVSSNHYSNTGNPNYLGVVPQYMHSARAIISFSFPSFAHCFRSNISGPPSIKVSVLP